MALITNIKSPETLIKNARTNYFPLEMLASKEYLDFRINSNDISSLRNINNDFDKILPKIIYENPEKPNGLILDGAYVNDVIKTSGFSSSKSIILNNTDAFIFYDKARSINGWTFDFDSDGLENKLIISNPKYLKNCTFEKNILIKFEQTNKKLITYYGEQYGIEKFLEFLKGKIDDSTCKFNRYYNDNGGILIPKKMVQYLKNIKEWQDLFYNKLTTPYKFVLS